MYISGQSHSTWTPAGLLHVSK